MTEYGRNNPQTIENGGKQVVIFGSPSSQAITDAMASIEAQAGLGPVMVPSVRVADHDGKVVLDLGDDQWRAVVIGPDGWKVVDRPPCPFIRPNGLRALPIPVKGARIDELRSILNVGGDADFRLAVAWLLAALRRKGPFPVLVVGGEQGSAKSTFCRVLRRLVDPNSAELRSSPRDERDLLIAARNGWITAIDNLSFVGNDLSDSLCRIATGGGFATRALYSDHEEVLIEVCRPVLLNGIPTLASRPDLADRAVVLTLPVIPEAGRRTEAEFWLAFDDAAPRILGALLDGVSAGLRNLANTKLECLPRMADFALWSAAAFPAFGWSADDFESAYEANREHGTEDAIDADPLAAAIVAIAANSLDLLIVPSRLLEDINALVAHENRDKAWPKTAAKLSSHLRRVSPMLRRLGIDIVLDAHIGRGPDKKRAIRIRRIDAKKPAANPGETHSPRGDDATAQSDPYAHEHRQYVHMSGDDGGDPFSLNSCEPEEWGANP